MTVKATKTKITDFVQDDHNANEGTEHGAKILGVSLRDLRNGRSIVVDKNGQIIAGNKTQLAALEAGYDTAIVVESDGDSLIVHKRTDLDLDDPTGDARAMAYYDNGSALANIRFNFDTVRKDAADGLDLSDLFNATELKFPEFKELPEPDPRPVASAGTAVEAQETIDDLSGELWQDGEPEALPEADGFTCPACGHEWTE